MLPPGTHMVSYNAASRTGDFAPTSSFFVHLAPSQVYVRRWSSEQELLFDLPAGEVMLALNSTHLATKAVSNGSTRYRYAAANLHTLLHMVPLYLASGRCCFVAKGAAMSWYLWEPPEHCSCRRSPSKQEQGAMTLTRTWPPITCMPTSSGRACQAASPKVSSAGCRLCHQATSASQLRLTLLI